MTFETFEEGVQTGEVIELYQFIRGVTTYRFNSSEADYVDTTVSPNVTYTSANLQRENIATSSEKARNRLTITAPRNFTVSDLYRIATPTDVISLTLYRVHRSDGEKAIAWAGRIASVKFDGSMSTIVCEPLNSSMKRIGLRRMYQKACPHALYGDACGLTKGDFDTVTTVSAISGTSLSVGALTSFTTYGGGFVEWVDGNGNTERRFIISKSGPTGSPEVNVLTLDIAFNGIAVTDSVTVFPGCTHTMTGCDTDFSNIDNYGGQPFIPEKDLYKGDPVF